MKKPTYTKDQFIQAAMSSTNIAQALRKLNLTCAGRARARFREKALEFGVDISHFTGQATYPKGRQVADCRRKLTSIMVENSNYPTWKLKNRLIQEGILTNVCEKCGQGPEWHGEPLVLHLDHINGVSNDHRLTNLRILCPNCHTQTDTYCGKNRKYSQYSKPL